MNVSYVDPGKNLFVSVTDRARIVDAPALERDLWNPMNEAFFPDGPDDPDLVLRHREAGARWRGTMSRVAQVEVDPHKIREFVDADAFYEWLRGNHDKADEVWIKIHKVRSGLPSITPKEAIDIVLCWGWIDGIRKGFDDKSFLQRYTPRRPKSVWSQVNVANVARLVAEGRMTEHGLKQVEAAKADGRWDRAYTSSRNAQMPPDLLAAIEAEPAAKEMLDKLTAQNRFALIFRVDNLKTEAGRKRKIAQIVEMLKQGETFYPQKEQ